MSEHAIEDEPRMIGAPKHWWTPRLRCPLYSCRTDGVLVPKPGRYFMVRTRSLRYTLGNLLIHLVGTPHAPEWLLLALLRLGVLDSTSEGGTAFWRWDFWRANYRKALRDPHYHWSTTFKR